MLKVEKKETETVGLGQGWGGSDTVIHSEVQCQ